MKEALKAQQSKTKNKQLNHLSTQPQTQQISIDQFIAYSAKPYTLNKRTSNHSTS
jgi:hypothetical protein